jgi:prepilin-type N-terminal cleavage/methylation domain-containing protein
MHAAPRFSGDLRADRRAFTLLEVLVALVILGVGVLGLSGHATLVSRLVGDGARATRAATVATARLEQLTARSCADISSGSLVSYGIEERWSVAPMSASGPLTALEVQLSVTYRLRGRAAGRTTRTQQFRGAVPCR